MSLETERTAAFGIGGTVGSWIGGALGGAIGAAAFGVLLWLVDPAIVGEVIPGLYGLEASMATGTVLHLVHGAIVGIVFAVLVSRPAVMGTLRMDVASAPLSGTGLTTRVVAAGFVYGLALWAILPIVVQPLWVGFVGGDATAAFPAAAVESLLGHLLFGVVLGLVYAVSVDLSDRPAADSPFA